MPRPASFTKRNLWTVVRLMLFSSFVVVLASCTGTTSADVRTKQAEKLGKLAEPAPTTQPVIAAPVSTIPRSKNACVASLTVAQKVGQLIVVLTSKPANVTQFAADGKIGGVGLLTDQTAGIEAQLQTVKAAAPLKLAIGSDEEGGTVQRLKGVLGPLPSARDSAKTMSVQQVGDMWRTYATKLADIGITMNFGPVLDVGYGIAIKSRAFSDQTAVVTDYGLEVVKQTNSGGVIPVVKHWPGLGSGSADPHGKIALVGDLATLRSKDFPPFEAAIAAGVQAVMVTHVNIPDVTEGTPATLSPAAIKILRTDQGFKGVIMTDSLGMGAITRLHTQPEAAELAILAGNDVVLTNGAESVQPVFNRLVDAVQSGRITEQRIDQSVERWFRMKGIDGPCPAANAAAATPSGSSGPITPTSQLRDPNGLTAVSTASTATSITAASVSTPTTINERSSQG